MTEQRQAKHGWWSRRRESRRAKRQEARERRYYDGGRLDPAARAYADADNHARRWTAYGGGGGGG